MARQSAMIARLLAAQERKREATREFAQQYALDMTLVTLHRMGWGKRRCAAFTEELRKTYDEYACLVISDSKDDKEVVYSKTLIDRALSFLEELFKPWEVRYGFCDTTAR